MLNNRSRWLLGLIVVPIALLLKFAGVLPDQKYQGSGYRDTPAQARKSNVEYLFQRGVEALDAQDNDGAVSYFSQVIAKAPDEANAYASRAIAYDRLRDYERALADYAKAIELEPKESAHYIGRADVYAGLKDFDQAAVDLTTAIRLHDNNPDAYVARGWIREHQHDYQRAIDDYQAAIALEENELQAYNNLAWIWATCPKTPFRNAAKSLDYGLHICKASKWKQTPFFDTLAAAYAANGKFEEAVHWQKKAVAAPDAYDSEEEREKGRRRLKLYEQGKSYTDD